MSRIRFTRVTAVIGAGVALAVGTAIVAATIALADPPGPIQLPPRAPVSPVLSLVPEPPIYRPTGGPFIGEAQALANAAKAARGPIAKQDIRLLHYRDVVDYTGARTMTIDLDREVYVVVTSAPFVGRGGAPTCQSYIAVIDATTGDGLSVICGDGAWPSRLPAAFQ